MSEYELEKITVLIGSDDASGLHKLVTDGKIKNISVGVREAIKSYLRYGDSSNYLKHIDEQKKIIANLSDENKEHLDQIDLLEDQYDLLHDVYEVYKEHAMRLSKNAKLENEVRA
jgi:Arc/MetJ-type ribon-helix-helix transcriptional regulator